MKEPFNAMNRIQQDIDVYEGNLPDLFSIAWKGYLFGLLEWQLTDSITYARCMSLLPNTNLDPILETLSSKASPKIGIKSIEINIIDEIRPRIQNHINTFDGNLSEDYIIAWNGYLAALYEWGVINGHSYDVLISMMPPISNPNPVLTIFSGRVYELDIRQVIEEDIKACEGNLPERHAIFYQAFLRGLWEYGAISPKSYKKLLCLLPTPLILEDLNIFPKRGQVPKSPGFGVSTQVCIELNSRIQENINAFHASLPDYYLIAWKAYLLSLAQWLVLDWEDYQQLLTLLPPLSSSDPVQRIAEIIKDCV